jgi:hypothetical protein
MFSEKFYAIEKYDLNSKEYIGTYENIFSEFTSIQNDIYKPELSENLKNKFKDVLNYKFNNKTIPFSEKETFFGAFYFGSEVLNYDVKTKIHYNYLRKQSFWEDFVLSTNLHELMGLKYIIDEKIRKTDVLTNYLSDITFDRAGKVTGIGIFDVEYNKTKDNSDINFINEFKNTEKRYNNFVIFNTNRTYKSILKYKLPVVNGTFRKGIDEKNLVRLQKIKYEDYHQEIITDMIENNIINQDDADFIQSHLSGERYFTLEFDIDANEKIVNRTVGIVTHNLFREL